MVNVMRPVHKVGAVIPVYNPTEEFVAALAALNNQTYSISQVIVIDSSPEGNTQKTKKLVEDACTNLKQSYLRISTVDFDHGNTRNFGVSKLDDSDAVLFLTQDGIMSLNCVENLIDYLNRNNLAGVYARQSPRDGATELEIIERKLTYPSLSKINQGAPRLIDDVLLSNVCSIFRIDAFKAVGGFPNIIITAEDIVIANKLLSQGYCTGYCAQAIVKHSHFLSFTGIVKRYFDTGVMHSDWEREIPFNTAKGKGIKLVMNELKHIILHKPTELGSLFLSVLGKVIGYSLGRKNSFLSVSLKRKLSQNKGFWR
jgi:rhamnosyltransferase